MRRYIGIRKTASGVRIALIMAMLLCITGSAGVKIDAAKWTHFTIADPLPGPVWGTGGIPLADFDGDVDTDIITKIWNKNGNAYHADYWRNDNE